MQTNEAIPVLKMLKELIKPNYPQKYTEAVEIAIERLREAETEYREEMRL